MCKISGCLTKSRYKSQDVCQKHYFRKMRNGSYLLSGKKSKNGVRKDTIDSSGYVLLYIPNHPLSRKNGFVCEHRVVIYSIYGDRLPDCELCGAHSSWKSRRTHIDHINEVRTDNAKENLRVLCNACNTRRTKRVEHTISNRSGIEWSGEIKTAQEWGRDERVPAQGHLIRQRLSRGHSVYDAFFSKKKTHKV